MLNPGTHVNWWMLWAAIPYGLVMRWRARCYQWGWLPQRRLPVPVISVGNLTVGGTGKTPIVIMIAEWLIKHGRRVAILSRGYRRISTEPFLLVSNGEQMLAGPAAAGDEPFLMAQRCPQAIVAVGADRYALGQWVMEQIPVDCFLLDDGFQHLGLHRDENLLLIDATDADGLRAIVPAGRLREPLTAVARATAILITRANNPIQIDRVLRLLGGDRPGPSDVYHVTFQPESLISVTTQERRTREWCQGKRAVLCSAIGHAQSFRSVADELGCRVLDEVTFPDHHHYIAAEVEAVCLKAKSLQADVVLTTEKDAGKLSVLLAPADLWWAVRLSTRVIVGEEQLRQRIASSFRSGRVEACV